MKKPRFAFNIVDLLVGFAVLMILAALFVPHFVPPTGKGKAGSPNTVSGRVQSAR
jgi:hypothetical protein